MHFINTSQVVFFFTFLCALASNPVFARPARNVTSGIEAIAARQDDLPAVDPIFGPGAGTRPTKTKPPRPTLWPEHEATGGRCCRFENSACTVSHSRDQQRLDIEHEGCKSDPAVKQILLIMNGSGKDSFMIEDLDDHHMAIKPDTEYGVRKDLETELEKNTYSFD